MAVDVPGLVVVVVFYVIILITGIIAARKTARSRSADEAFVADRSMGLWISFFTLAATCISGGSINGAAEAVAFSGLVWTNAPFMYMVSMLLAGFITSPKLRRAGYVTMFDPIQAKLGRRIGGLLVFPILLGDWLWAASILSALGSTLALILDLDQTICIIGSACIAVVYTFFGGLYSVAYTDIIQLIILVVGLLVAFPFTFYHPSVNLSTLGDTWVGQIPTPTIATYVDKCLQFLCGSFTWQVYYQRVLACKTVRIVKITTVAAVTVNFLVSIPPLAVGLVGAATDWNATDYDGPIPIPKDQHSFIFPMVLKYLCPRPIAVVGIGAVAAAVMSSADSAVLSSGTVFAKNIYKDIFRQRASDREVMWVMRGGVLVSGIVSCLIAIFVKTVYGLFYLATDLTYVVTFPQFICVLWVKFVNGYGSATAFIIAFFLRIAAGDSLLQFPALIKFPFYSDTWGQRFPFRTFIVLLNYTVLISVSWLTDTAFRRGWVSKKYDFLHAVQSDGDGSTDRDGNGKQMTEFKYDNMAESANRDKTASKVA